MKTENAKPSTPVHAHCYLVLAGTLTEAEQWAREKSLPARPAYRNGWIYASSPESIHGIRGVEVVTLDRFWDRRDAGRIRELVDVCVASGHAVKSR